jgi:hypothetical protein
MDNSHSNELKLYWVTTDDHCEDWFVVARSPMAAARFHETAEGYNRGEARAEEIMPVPNDFHPEKGWPSDELIRDLGGVFVHEEYPRIVQINNKKYCEGMLEAVIRELDDESGGNQEQSNAKKKDTTLH